MNNKIKISLLFICSLVILNSTSAQLKYWVMFKNKNGTPYAISNPNAFLTQKSIDRRNMYNTVIDITDLPVTPSYVTQVDNVSNVTVIYASKWMNGVVISVPAANLNVALNTINSFPFVQNMAQVNRYSLNLPKTPTLAINPEQNMRTSNTTSFNMGGSTKQNQQMNLDCMHNFGYRGQGMTIAVLDVGFKDADTNPVFDSLRNRNGILGTRDFVSGGTSVYEDPDHGAVCLSCMAAVKPGVIMGSAPMANYWLLRTEDGGSETLTEEYNWIRGAEFADSVGADILTTSLGYTTFDNPNQNHTYASLNGRTAPMSIASTMAVRKGMFVLNAAGNEGDKPWQFICVAGDADSICTVGAIDSVGAYAAFSSVGPTSDGRIKPDLVARGYNTWVASPSGVCYPGSGTSFATPLLAGAVACYWQAHRNVNNILLLKALKNGASNKNSPNNYIGWGRPDLCSYILGIAENRKDSHDFEISPNPFNSLVTINLEKINGSTSSIEINDVLGKTILSANTSSKNFTLNLIDLDAGVYTVKVSSGANSVTKKIIKQ